MSDLISRADAIYAVCKLCVDGQTAKVDGYFIPIRDALENVLKALPSADAERETVTVYRGECIIHWNRPHGEWRKGEVKYDVDDDVLYETYYKCDQCGYVENLDYPPNYCANCGADMRKESDDE